MIRKTNVFITPEGKVWVIKPSLCHLPFESRSYGITEVQIWIAPDIFISIFHLIL